MTIFDVTELARLRGSRETFMPDTVTRLAYANDGGGNDPYGNPQPGWTSGASLPCTFVERATSELAGVSEISDIDADCYLSLDETISGQDRVAHTHNYGVAIAPQYIYEIVGAPMRGPTALHLELRRVTDGS